MKRSGFTLLETVAAVVLLAVASTVCVQMLVAGAASRRAADQRLFATREAANVMERLMSGPRDRLTPEAVETIALDDEVVDSLPGAALTVTLADESVDEGPSATRVTVTLAWHGHRETASPHVRLVAWHYGTREGKP